MRRSARSSMRLNRLETAVISLLAGVGALAVTSVILSAFAAVCDMPESMISAMSGIALAAGCFCCAFCTANRRRKNGLASGFLCGLAVFCGILVIGSLSVKIFSAGGFFTKLLIVVSSSALGGIKGVNTRPFFGK